jgi:hypothetical protein
MSFASNGLFEAKKCSNLLKIRCFQSVQITKPDTSYSRSTKTAETPCSALQNSAYSFVFKHVNVEFISILMDTHEVSSYPQTPTSGLRESTIIG